MKDVCDKSTVLDSIIIASDDPTEGVRETAMEQSEKFTLSIDSNSSVSLRFDVTRSIS